MTEERLALAELLEKAGEGDFLRAVAEAVLQLLMEADVEGLIGAGRYERSSERSTWRNGYRERILDTRLGSLQLRIPKLRQGSYFPPFLEARKSSDRSAAASGARGAMATASVSSIPGSARCNCGSPNCGKAAISRRFLKPARVQIGAQQRAEHVAQWLPRAYPRYPARLAATADPQIAARQLFPAVS